MAALAGIIAFEPRPSLGDDVERMVDAMAHRGPDGTSTIVSGPVAVGHCAFHSTPEAQYESLPHVANETGVILTADARIDNRDELLTRLGPFADATITDADLILAAYYEWGTDAAAHLIGDFAFAIWDPKDQRLYCGRDHIGIKPFYYYSTGSFFAFGTEINALLALDDVPREVNEFRMAEYLASRAVDAESTLFKGIHRLPPAHILTTTVGGEYALTKYWTPDLDRTLELDSDAEYEQAFRDIFTEAVRCRLRSNGPVGVMVSGGLDSSSVACVARDLLQDQETGPLDTFTAQFGYEGADESEYIDALRAQGGFRMHDVPLHGEDPTEDLDRVIECYAQPPFITNVYLPLKTRQVASSRGIRVLMDGCEGDISVSHGLARIADLTWKRQWDTLRHELKALELTTGTRTARIFRLYADAILHYQYQRHPISSVLTYTHQVSGLTGMSHARVIWTYLLRPLGSWLKGVVTRRRPVESASGIMTSSLASRTSIEARLKNPDLDLNEIASIERWIHWSAFTREADGIASTQEEADTLHAMEGGEARHPFYDKRLIEFCLALPSSQKLRSGYSRSILRRALRHTLPQEIRDRTTKGDLSENFYTTLSEDRQGTINALLQLPQSPVFDFVEYSKLRRAAESGRLVDVWKALAVSLWMTRFVTRQSEAQTRFRSKRRISSGPLPEAAVN